MPDNVAPLSSVARFGVAFLGPKFKWAWVEPDTSDEAEEGALKVVEGEFHAHPGLSFEDQVEYQRQSALLQSLAVVEQRRVAAKIEEIGKVEAEGGENVSTEVLAQLGELAEGTVDSERARWALQITQVLMLVAPQDRDKLRIRIETANPADVRELKDHLEGVVITRTIKAVETAGGVDPT